jgi:hypothetical protein
MDRWSVLGLAPTEDITAIKKAYAKMLKIHHPEEDPEGFQRLREAYDKAIKYAKEIRTVRDTAVLDQDEIPALDQAAAYTFGNIQYEESIFQEYEDMAPNETDLDLAEQEYIDIYQLNEEFMQNVRNLYKDFFMRNKAESWVKLLDSQVMWDIHNRESLSYQMLYFLKEHHYLPQEVWRILDNNFAWSQNYHLYAELEEDFVEYIVNQVNQPFQMSYSYLKEVEGLNYDAYLECRERAFDSLKEGNIKKMAQYIKEAEEVYSGDPELLYLKGEYLARKRKAKEALAAIEAVLEIIPDHLNGLLYRAKKRYDKEKFGLALQDYTRILELAPDNTDILLPLAKCSLEMKDYHNARKYFRIVLEIGPRDPYVVNDFEMACRRIRRVLRQELKKHPGDRYIEEQLNSLRSDLRRYDDITAIVNFIKKQSNFTKIFIVVLILACFYFIFFRKH